MLFFRWGRSSQLKVLRENHYHVCLLNLGEWHVELGRWVRRSLPDSFHGILVVIPPQIVVCFSALPIGSHLDQFFALVCLNMWNYPSPMYMLENVSPCTTFLTVGNGKIPSSCIRLLNRASLQGRL